MLASLIDDLRFKVVKMNGLKLGASTALGLAVKLCLCGGASAGPTESRPSFAYVANSLTEAVIYQGPWTLHEDARTGLADGASLGHDASAALPFAGYCAADGGFSVNRGASLMQPYYFPFVRRNGDLLEGFFDYRPRNEQEATVAATSADGGVTWTFTGAALALNPYCPASAADADNREVIVRGARRPYGSVNGSDDGLGRPFVLKLNGVERLYHLNRAAERGEFDQLVTHVLQESWAGPLSSLPDYGFVSPFAAQGYPALEPKATPTSGLVDAEAIIGAVKRGGTAYVVYVSKIVGGDKAFGADRQCPATPPFALAAIDAGKPRKPSHDVTMIRVATTSDGVAFQDVGAASGLNDPTSVALNGLRYLASGSLVPLADGRYGLFFGGGNCLDNDSEGFHFIGYAETAKPVERPEDLLIWRVIHGFDNPILSSDAVTDPQTSRRYPSQTPIVSVANAQMLAPAKDAPSKPAGGYNLNFFSGRAYAPQAVYAGDRALTIVFSGYNTPQPANNLADYRTIGRFQLRVAQGYFSRF